MARHDGQQTFGSPRPRRLILGHPGASVWGGFGSRGPNRVKCRDKRLDWPAPRFPPSSPPYIGKYFDL